MMYFWIISMPIAFPFRYFNKDKDYQREGALELLQHRLANGEIDKEEYKERKALLETDNYLNDK
ncbi:MAG: SHOCT domain-containing protein [Saprospiraceae bacterium]|nr:SHOCT domain-containing protein [Saprospiraceae bacterium]